MLLKRSRASLIKGGLGLATAGFGLAAGLSATGAASLATGAASHAMSLADNSTPPAGATCQSSPSLPASPLPGSGGGTGYVAGQRVRRLGERRQQWGKLLLRGTFGPAIGPGHGKWRGKRIAPAGQ